MELILELLAAAAMLAWVAGQPGLAFLRTPRAVALMVATIVSVYLGVSYAATGTAHIELASRPVRLGLMLAVFVVGLAWGRVARTRARIGMAE